MDALTFVASLVGSLAWPVVVLVLVLAFREPIGRMVERLPKRLKAGPVEVEWPEVATEARVALAMSPEARALAPQGSLTERFAKMAADEPSAAILSAWSELEKELITKLTSVGIPEPKIRGAALARLARERDVISDATLEAIEGLAVLRNLSAHGGSEQVDREKALDFLTFGRRHPLRDKELAI
jgi:hypothetical protein